MKKEAVDRLTVFSTITGSKAYGTDTPESDTDTRGIAIMKDKSYYYGWLNNFAQYEDKVNDQVVYDIRKAFELMANANPNMLDLLFTDERFHIKTSPYWQMVIENRDAFLSKKARYTFTGYSFAQLKRIRTSRSWLLNPPKKKPERSDFGLPEEKMLGKETIGAFQWVLVNLLQNSLEHMNLTKETQEELEKANWIGLVQQKGVIDETADQIQAITGASDAWMESMRKEQGYNRAKQHWTSYQQWKASRNDKRSELEAKYGYDTKHASHLVRLLRMGEEVLSTGKVIVYRPDREELLAIRNGAWTYEQVEEYAETMEKRIIEVSRTSKLPEKPNRPALDKLCVQVIEWYLTDK